MWDKWLRYYSVGTCVILMALMAACEHKQLIIPVDYGEVVNVALDWSKASSSDKSSMIMFFYPIDGDSSLYWRFLLPADGGKIRIPLGRYRVAAYNANMTGVLLSGDSDFFSLAATTRVASLFEGLQTRSSSLPEISDSTIYPVRLQPDMVWAVSDYDVAVKSADTLKFRIDSATCIYHFNISNISNLDGVSRMCAALEGVAGKMLFAGLIPSPPIVSLPCEAKRCATSSVESTLVTFGRSFGDAPLCRLRLFFWLRNGANVECDFNNIGHLIDNSPNPYKVNVNLDQLVDLPYVPSVGGEEGAGGGINVGIDDWDIIDIELSN